MAVKYGYKQTEVGVIPEDWAVKPFGILVSALEAGVSVNSVDQEAITSTHDRSILKTSCVIAGRFMPEERKTIAPRDILRAKQPLRKDTIVISRMNTPALVGECGYIDQNYPDIFLPDRLWMTRHDLRLPHSVRWLAYLLSFRPFSRAIKECATGTSGSMKNISKHSLLEVQIPMPPTKAEQEAIAGALSDADALIESLEQLLAKKRQIKQGAMQELLTGKERLPGFTDKWVYKRLGDLGRWTGGMTPSMQNHDYWKNGTVPWISSGDVKSSRLTTTAFAVSASAIRNGATTLVPAKSIVIVTRSGILRRYLPVAMNTVPMAINQDIKALLPEEATVSDYLLHVLIHSGDSILARCLKSGTTVESIEFAWLKDFEIPVPSRAEQIQISGVLSDMDAEIAALETKLAKAHQIKQGMMQELLTGRIRLV